MATLSDLVVRLSLSAENFSNGLRAAQRETREFDKTIRPIRQGIDAVGSAFTTAGIAISAVGIPFAAAAKSAIDTADAFKEMSDRTGASVETLSALNLQANLAGTSMSTVETAMRASAKVLEDASVGSEKAAESFSKLGLNVEEILKLSPEERFFAIAKGLAGIEDPGLRAAIAMETWGRSGTELLPMLDSLAMGQDSVINSARELGQVISTDAAEAADEFNDSLTKLRSAVMGVFNAIASTGLLDKLADLINSMADGIATFARAHPNIVSVGAAIGGIALVIGPTLAGIGLMAKGIAGLIPVVTSIAGLLAGAGGLTSAITAVTAVLSGPVGIAIAIGAAATALGVFALKNDETRGALTTAWQSIKSAVGGVVDALGETFKAAADAWKAIWSVFGDDIVRVFRFHFDVLKGVVGPALEAVKGVFIGALNVIKGTLQVFTGVLTLDWTKFSEGIKNVWSGLWEAIKSILLAPINAVKNTISTFTSGVTDYFRDMYNRVVGQSYVPDMMDRIKDEFGRLPAIMTGPAEVEINKTVGLFQRMATALSTQVSNISGLVGSLFGSKVGSLVSNIGGRVQGIISSFRSGDIFGGILKSISGAIDIFKNIGAGRRAADQFVQEIQNPFGEAAIQLVDTFNAAAAAGKLTAREADAVIADLEDSWEEFRRQASQFSQQGQNEAKVVRQAFETLEPIMGNWLRDMRNVASGLEDTNTQADQFSDALEDLKNPLSDITDKYGPDFVRSLRQAADMMREAAQTFRESAMLIRSGVEQMPTSAPRQTAPYTPPPAPTPAPAPAAPTRFGFPEIIGYAQITPYGTRSISEEMALSGLPGAVLIQQTPYGTRQIPIDQIPQAQQGGYVKRGGIVEVHQGEMISPADTTRNLTVNVYVEGNMVGDERFARVLADKINTLVKDGGVRLTATTLLK